MASGKILNLSESLLPSHMGNGPHIVLPLSSPLGGVLDRSAVGTRWWRFSSLAFRSICEVPAAWLAQGWVLRGLKKSSDASALSSKCSLGGDGSHFGPLYPLSLPSLLSALEPLSTWSVFRDPVHSLLGLPGMHRSSDSGSSPQVAPTWPLGSRVLSKLLGVSAAHLSCGHPEGTPLAGLL